MNLEDFPTLETLLIQVEPFESNPTDDYNIGKYIINREEISIKVDYINSTNIVIPIFSGFWDFIYK